MFKKMCINNVRQKRVKHLVENFEILKQFIHDKDHFISRKQSE